MLKFRLLSDILDLPLPKGCCVLKRTQEIPNGTISLETGIGEGRRLRENNET